MQAVDFAEKVAYDTRDEARRSYDAMHERVYKFVTLLTGAAGGVSVYALGKLGSPGAGLQFAPLGALALWWFFIAGVVLLKGAASRTLPLGSSSTGIRERLLHHQKAPDADDGQVAAVWNTRWDYLRSVDEQIEAYRDGCSRRATVLDRAYWCLVCSPVVPALAYLLVSTRS